MARQTQRSDYPLWVRIGLVGLPTRASVSACLWLSIALAVGAGVYGFWDPRGFLGVAFLLSGLMYWLTLRWVDANGQW